MHASTLPLELLLQIFGLLDAKSFFAARKACRWWHLASLEQVTLRKLLETLPILPPVTPREHPCGRELQCLSTEASNALMLEWRPHDEHQQNMTSLFAHAKVPLAGLLTSFASGAQRLAAFDGQEIRLFNTSTPEWKLVAQRPLEERLGKGLWLRNCPLNSCKIALASDGHLLAIAFKSTIQVYDFSSDSGRCEVNDSVITSSDQCITGLEFEQHDHLLRVHLSLKGNVVYFGSPPIAKGEALTAKFEHWSSMHGLRNKFFDSSLLSTASEGVGGLFWLSGVQALQPLHDGYLFAAQRHGGGQSSRYTVVHARCISKLPTRPVQIDPSSVTEIARLESFLSSLDFGTGGLARHEIGTWEDMPSAHESCSKFDLTPDGTMLLLAEREKKRIWPSPVTQVFVYRLPSRRRIASLLGKDEEKRGISALPRHRIPAIPLCLGTVKGRVKNLESQRLVEERVSYRFTVTTDETARSWSLHGY